MNMKVVKFSFSASNLTDIQGYVNDYISNGQLHIRKFTKDLINNEFIEEFIYSFVLLIQMINYLL